MCIRDSNEETFRQSQEYFFYITLGIPFYMFGQAMNPVIRADGIRVMRPNSLGIRINSAHIHKSVCSPFTATELPVSYTHLKMTVLFLGTSNSTM